MFCVTSFIEHRGYSDPLLQRAALFDDRHEAISYANDLLEDVEGEYGEDWSERASETCDIARYSNGDVTWRAYITFVEKR